MINGQLTNSRPEYTANSDYYLNKQSDTQRLARQASYYACTVQKGCANGFKVAYISIKGLSNKSQVMEVTLKHLVVVMVHHLVKRVGAFKDFRTVGCNVVNDTEQW